MEDPGASRFRKGEILGLKWPDFDFRRKIITILKTKGQKKREIPIGLGISRLLLRQRKHPDSLYRERTSTSRAVSSVGRASAF
ncbi:hypothetical protein E3J59_00205 [Candidatus Aerophobetes bacterium]|uniref:Tyr recombinase domain-containing protein n=1 Tax=Aerophobetes bacterium TaxID=2030807 RepID=A0A523V1T7_UNCAE|nr:MAG: hypothetical protein E3J59_00205 [Candidatus Aerophobetes bacterium]